MRKRMSKVAAVLTAAVTAVAVAGCGAESGDSGGPVTIKFLSLAYQPPTVAAVKKIVDTFNEQHQNKIQVELIQGSFDTVNDQLVPQFQGGTAPDVIHSQASLISDFQRQGYLADLDDKLDKKLLSDIPNGVRGTVTDGDRLFGAPTLLQSYVVFANTDLLAAAGVTVPTGETLHWDDFRDIAKQASTGGRHGLGWGLKQPAATVMNLSLNFDGKFFDGTGREAKISVDKEELEVPKRIRQMLDEDKSLSPVSVTQSGADTLPGFYAGQYAMVVGADFLAQSITSGAPQGFKWTVLPPLTGTSSHQAADPQTLSMPEQSAHPGEAAEFINFYQQPENLAAVAKGDWLIPATTSASDVLRTATADQPGWAAILATGPQLVDAPFSHATNYPRWKIESAQPALQQYLAGEVDLDGLETKFVDGWQQGG